MTQTAPAQAFTAEERRQYIGASEIASIMGLDQWKTPLDVYNEKLGLSAPFEGNRHTLRGQRLEAVAAELYTELTGLKLRRKSAAFTHPEYPFIVGHIDRIVEGQKKLAEIKAPSVAAYRKHQREGLPQSMIVQMQVYLGLSGYETGTWIVFCADQMDIATFDVAFDADIYAAAINAAVTFWQRHVEANDPPRLDAEKTEYDIATHGGSVTVRDDETFLAKAAALREATELKRDAEELFEIAKKEIIEAVEGEVGVYQCPGLRLYYTQSPGRATLDKKALAAAFPQIDLKAFEKQGKPFFSLRSYFEG